MEKLCLQGTMTPYHRSNGFWGSVPYKTQSPIFNKLFAASATVCNVCRINFSANFVPVGLKPT